MLSTTFIATCQALGLGPVAYQPLLPLKALWLIIISNFGSDKPTGHLGSFLEKKAETQIQLEANTVNKEWITVKCKRSRGYAFETFSFKVNEIGLPEIVGDLYDPLQN